MSRSGYKQRQAKRRHEERLSYDRAVAHAEAQAKERARELAERMARERRERLATFGHEGLTLPPQIRRDIAFLCHPDRNPDDQERAHRVMGWLP